jgi:hypothetical protein
MEAELWSQIRDRSVYKAVWGINETMSKHSFVILSTTKGVQPRTYWNSTESFSQKFNCFLFIEEPWKLFWKYCMILQKMSIWEGFRSADKVNFFRYCMGVCNKTSQYREYWIFISTYNIKSFLTHRVRLCKIFNIHPLIFTRKKRTLCNMEHYCILFEQYYVEGHSCEKNFKIIPWLVFLWEETNDVKFIYLVRTNSQLRGGKFAPVSKFKILASVHVFSILACRISRNFFSPLVRGAHSNGIRETGVAKPDSKFFCPGSQISEN